MLYWPSAIEPSVCCVCYHFFQFEVSLWSLICISESRGSWGKKGESREHIVTGYNTEFGDFRTQYQEVSFCFLLIPYQKSPVLEGQYLT